MKNPELFYKNTIIKNTGIVLLLCLLIVFFYSNRVFLTGLNYGEDLRAHDIPLASFFVNTVKKGAFPLWDPYKICGLPFFEVSFMGPYYPFVFLYFIFPILKAINFGFLIHILLSGIFMFFLSQELKFTTLISFFCAFSWMLSSVFQQYSESGWLVETISVSYLPIIIYFFIKMTRSKYSLKIIFSLLLSWCIAFAILGGKPDITLIILYSFIIFSIPSIRYNNNASFLLISLLVGLLLSTVVWGPLLIQATRYGPLLKLTTFRYNMKEMGNFLFPISIRRGFAGKLVFIFGLLGIFSRRMPFKINFLFLNFISLLLMFFDMKIMGIELLKLVPFANEIKKLWYWHASYIFSLIILSGASLDRLRLWLIDNKKALFITLSIVIGLQLGDLWNFNKRFYPKDFPIKLEEYFPVQPLVSFFKKDSSLFRVSNQLYSWPLFREGQGILEEINCFESRARGVNLYKVGGKSSLTYKFKICPSKRIMDICNIKYIITPQKLRLDHFSNPLITMELANGEIVYLYRNKFSFPRAFVLDNIDQNLVERVLLNSYTAPLLSLEISDEAWNMLSNYKDVDIKWSPNTYTISPDCGSNSFLFLSEMNEPGWKAEVDGLPVKVFSPFNFFMGVFLPPGKHLVKFQFRPLYFYIFFIVSISAFLCSIFLITYFVIIKYRKKVGMNTRY